MEIRHFKELDAKELWGLFYSTVHNINSQDYSADQIEAWAPSDIDINIPLQKYRDIKPFVAIHNGKIVAYADIQTNGYIDHFYCHHEFQGQGIGRMLFATLEKEARKMGTVTMHSNVSITAKPFFEAMGFMVEKEQLVKIGNQQFKNFRMIRKYEA